MGGNSGFEQRWSDFVKLRFEVLIAEGSKLGDLVGREQVLFESVGTALEQLIEASCYQTIIDEYIFMSSSLFDRKVINPESLTLSKDDYHVFVLALKAHVTQRLAPQDNVNKELREKSFAGLDEVLETAMLVRRNHYYKTLFESVDQSVKDLRVDAAYSHFAKLSDTERVLLLVDEQHLLYPVILAQQAKLQQIAVALRQLAIVYTPHLKLQVLEQWMSQCSAFLSSLQLQSGLDDLLPVCIYTVLQATVSCLATELLFIDTYMSASDRSLLRNSGQFAYIWTTFSSCVNFSLSIAKSAPLPPQEDLLLVEIEGKMPHSAA
jgi:hypothetical protein